MKRQIKTHLLELLSKDEIDIEWWDKYLDLLFSFRKGLLEEVTDQNEATVSSETDDKSSQDDVYSELTASFEEMNKKIVESNQKVLESIKASLPTDYTLPNQDTMNFLKSQTQQKES
ncbi:hypothetical protein HOO54_12630 [Bacillus sp. WMMC1349]|uniref:hypothetical protein n=1 Tax=Bacillus sp. WMMC1349 TaxID=2736254 RepID=UPI001555B58B|nr:hypothetical protein [Bacillus sp. WMMC1349]NPC93054.1 hypothetical protein [Bacillus sp. WMMC1349]